MTPQTETFLSTRKASELLGVSLRTVQLWVESGNLRAWKTEGGHRRILRSSVEQLLQKRVAQIEKVSGHEAVNVVVVEDDSDLQEFYRVQIMSWQLPIKVVVASNGFDGLLQIGQLRPALVIADLMMPEMNGFRMIQAVKENPELAATQIVVVTVLEDEEIANHGGLPSDVLVLRKPVPFDRIEDLVRDRLAVLRGSR